MVVAEFHDLRLARIYDLVCNPRADFGFYTALAGDTPLRILDLCCGTGELAAALALRGHHLTGVDGAAPMLAVARDRPGGDHVTWIEADIRAFALPGPYDLAVMTGHAFQVLLTDADTLAVLRTVRAALAPDGRFAFETRNPLVRGWEEWTPERSRLVRPLPDGGDLEYTTRVDRIEADRVSFTGSYRFLATGEVLTSRQTLRFPSREVVDRLLATADFTIDACYGDWDASLCTDTSPEIILIAR